MGAGQSASAPQAKNLAAPQSTAGCCRRARRSRLAIHATVRRYREMVLWLSPISSVHPPVVSHPTAPSRSNHPPILNQGERNPSFPSRCHMTIRRLAEWDDCFLLACLPACLLRGCSLPVRHGREQAGCGEAKLRDSGCAPSRGPTRCCIVLASCCIVSSQCELAMRPRCRLRAAATAWSGGSGIGVGRYRVAGGGRSSRASRQVVRCDAIMQLQQR
ncbi:hypothetical protein BDV95DRAFT_382227 [Massariosphaeria phaeospora]|uniref:Uncharacterized protein n=1 Tax=Massariosphaeria phaeospora TaxID=100035 RepID=A0A7C8M9F1_9PLEO|nr:hypothetical protein BDV95DRAFT_382227 [Massariosphaeria phaeospora]